MIKEHGTHMYYDKQGRPIDFATLAKLTEDPTYSFIARHEFEDESFLVTLWTGMRLSLREKRVFESRYYSTYGYLEFVSRWETEEEARKGHEEMIHELLQYDPQVLISKIKRCILS